MNEHLLYVLTLFDFTENKGYFQTEGDKRLMFEHRLARAHIEVTAKGKFSCFHRGKTTLIKTRKELIKWLAKNF